MSAPVDKLDIVRRFREVADEVIVPLSCGKDSLAALELLRAHGFRLKAFFLYVVPGIGFQERYLSFVERRYGLEVARLPHPQLATYVRAGHYRNASDFPRLEFKDMEDGVRGLLGGRWMAGGEKKIDSLERRGMISRCGGVDPVRERAYPLADWNDRDVFALLKRAAVPLPPDYRLFGSSWGGRVNAASMAAIKHEYPDDFARVCEFFPFANAAALKHELRTSTPGGRK